LYSFFFFFFFFFEILVPLLQKFGAKDIQKFYKKGRNLRLDTTLGGIDLRSIPRIIKGNISVIIRYEENTGRFEN